MDRKRKRELRDLNLRAWNAENNLLDVATSLDSSLKKNTAFIKRLRTGIVPSAQPAFLVEIKTLSLQKYLSEIISATAEGLNRLKTPSEIATGVEVVSALHLRFGPSDFTKQLGWLLGRGLTPPDRAQVKSWSQEVREREEKERLARHRILLRVISEFWLCGILRGLDDVERPDDIAANPKQVAPEGLRSNEGPPRSKIVQNGTKSDGDTEPFPLEVLKELLGHDPEHVNLPLAVLFVRNFSWDILGLRVQAEEPRRAVNADGSLSEDRNEETHEDAGVGEDTPIIDESLRQRFINVLDRYLQSLKTHIVRDRRSLQSQEKRNAEAYVKSGEIFEDRQANFEKQTKALERLVANAQVLCDVLGAEMPDLSSKDTSEAAASTSVAIIKAGEYLKATGDAAGIWADEEERRFYENLVDLRGRVPSILLDDSKKLKSESEDAGPAKKDTPITASDTTDSNIQSSDDQSTAIVNKTVGAQVDAVIVRLPDLQTKEMVDQLALDFCFLNSKASRNRLIKALQDIPKGRTDLLTYYARLIATLGQYMPDILQSLISYLDDEFRSLQRRKTKDFLGSARMLNIRYLAELTKFGVVPDHVIFHCFKVSLDDFSRMNIEIIANLLENCGRFLLRNPETAQRMNSFLETLSRKKSAQHLGQQERMLIENALYYVDPPQRAAIQQKERTPMDLFIRQLIYLDMTKRNYMKILKSIRKLHWEEPEVVGILEHVFSKPGKVKFSNIHLLAVLLGALYRYHQDFAIGVIDNLLESIYLGLEQNDFKFNQRRVAEVKYLGELYNYKMVDSAVIFDTLYRILTMGHEGGRPTPGKTTPFDMSDDFFRVRLVCTVLDTCGVCFDRGSSRKKLDFFLTFFQYYVLTKDPLPLEVDFLLQDTFNLVRPQWKIAGDITEASKLFNEAIATNYKASDSSRPTDAGEDNEDSMSDDELGDDDAVAQPAMDELSGDEAEVADDEVPVESGNATSEEEEEQIVVLRPEEQLDPEVEAEFDREFERMMVESLDSRKFERKTHFDVPLPLRKAQLVPVETFDDGTGSGSGTETPPNTMAFSLMTKKGNRQQTRTIELPSDSNFAVSMKSQQAAEREEQQRIKNLVLNYDLQQETDQHDGIADFSCGPILFPLERNPNAKGLQFRPRPVQRQLQQNRKKTNPTDQKVEPK